FSNSGFPFAVFRSPSLPIGDGSLMAGTASMHPRRADGAQAASAARLAGLGNRFVELLGRGLDRQQFAAQLAALIMEAVRLRAIAVMGYNRSRDGLVMLAEQGLRPEGRAALGDGADCSWDI